MIDYHLSYTDVLELILVVTFLFFISNYLNDEFVCRVNYNMIDVNTSVMFNISDNFSRIYYFSKEDTLFLLDKNKYIGNYDTKVSCNWKFLIKK